MATPERHLRSLHFPQPNCGLPKRKLERSSCGGLRCLPNLVRRKERTSPTGPAPTMTTGRCGASPPPPARDEKGERWRRPRRSQVTPRPTEKRRQPPPPAIDGIVAPVAPLQFAGGVCGFRRRTRVHGTMVESRAMAPDGSTSFTLEGG
jgi:hypothetical protein